MSLTPFPCVTSSTWDIMFRHGKDISSCEVTRLMIVSWDKLIDEETIVFCSKDRIRGRRHKRHVNFVFHKTSILLVKCDVCFPDGDPLKSINKTNHWLWIIDFLNFLDFLFLYFCTSDRNWHLTFMSLSRPL